MIYPNCSTIGNRYPKTPRSILLEDDSTVKVEFASDSKIDGHLLRIFGKNNTLIDINIIAFVMPTFREEILTIAVLKNDNKVQQFMKHRAILSALVGTILSALSVLPCVLHPRTLFSIISGTCAKLEQNIICDQENGVQ